MENPYSREQILRLIERKYESLKVDYKRTYPLDDPKHQRELIKDITAIANTIESDDTLEDLGIDPNYGFIIIGYDEKEEIFYDISTLGLDDAKLQQHINERVEPRVKFLFVSYEFEDPSGNSKHFGVIVISPSERPPHRVSKNIVFDKLSKTELRAGECFVRVGTSTSPATDAEMERLFAYRTRFSESEQLLQKEEFRISQSELEQVESLYVSPGGVTGLLDTAQRLLWKNRFLFIRGEMGAGKRTMALHLASRLLSEKQTFRVQRLTRTISLASLLPTEDTDPSLQIESAILIIPEFFGLFRFERLDVENDISAIERLIRTNFIIVTSSDTVYTEMLRETRLGEWELLGNAQIRLSSDSYTLSNQRDILERHVNLAVQKGVVNSEQASWVRDSLNASAISLESLRLPLDIKRLVYEYLPRINDVAQLPAAVQKIGHLRSEIRSWFHELEVSSQVFVLTLAIFNGMPRHTIWSWYQTFSVCIRSMNPVLAIVPLGVSIAETQPYVNVTESGQITFSYPSVHLTILTIIAQEYREYFLQIAPSLQEASLPAADIDDTEINYEIERTHPIREMVSAAAGEIGKYGLEDIISLLTAWASYEKGRVRIAAVDTLVIASQSASQVGIVKTILRDWAEEPSVALRWTAAITAGHLATIEVDWSLEFLSRISKDNSKWVRSSVPQAIFSLLDSKPNAVRRILTALGADADPFTRRQVSNVLRKAIYRHPHFVLDLLRDWVTKTSGNRIWTAARTILSIRKLYLAERASLLSALFKKSPKNVGKALADIVKEDKRDDSSLRALLNEYISQGWEGRWAGFGEFYKELVKAIPDLAELAWKILREWTKSPDTKTRIAAAHILTHLKVEKSDESAPLLHLLLLDQDSAVAEAASMEPLISIAIEDLADEEAVDTELTISLADLGSAG